MKILNAFLSLLLSILCFFTTAPQASATELSDEARTRLTQVLQTCSSEADAFKAYDCFKYGTQGEANYTYGCSYSHYVDTAVDCFKLGYRGVLAGEDPRKVIDEACMVASPLAYEKAACFNSALGVLVGPSKAGSLYSGCGAGEPPLARIACYRTGLRMLREQAPLLSVIEKSCAAFPETTNDQIKCLHAALGTTSGLSSALYFGCPVFMTRSESLACYREGIARALRRDLQEVILYKICSAKDAPAFERAACFEKALMPQYFSATGVSRIIGNCSRVEQDEERASCYATQMRDYIGID